MPKRIRNEHIYIASQIDSWIDDNNIPKAVDEKTKEYLNPEIIDDKIIIYERQVNEWFLNRASDLVELDNYGFIVLMICLSYLEGVEQYREGISSNHQSPLFFRNAVHRIFPNKFTDDKLDDLYNEARCGLYHNGMVKGKVIIDNGYTESIQFRNDETIRINPKKLLEAIRIDFNNYLNELRAFANIDTRGKFNRMFSNI